MSDSVTRSDGKYKDDGPTRFLPVIPTASRECSPMNGRARPGFGSAPSVWFFQRMKFCLSTFATFQFFLALADRATWCSSCLSGQVAENVLRRRAVMTSRKISVAAINGDAHQNEQRHGDNQYSHQKGTHGDLLMTDDTITIPPITTAPAVSYQRPSAMTPSRNPPATIMTPT